ncbi:hypothetical protein [Curtobacterium herbarum]|uniref:Uncharacterized protein n=1 Tax=Curtobacterium herbarum TaxID=150122 RepID=A0ABN1ZG14_9MICO|nr:hypothetical protein [Curtobacterium herbarum]MBM7475572.1 hypothetical protein [Curtobacterium herbarum]MCS6543486.1 hypothetical protein [Curtobacterium herbarum]
MGVLTVRDLDRILAHSTVPVPPEVESVMARAQKDDEVFADRFSAAEFVTMVRSKYLAREPNLRELIEPLGGLGSAPVLFCQVESGEEVVSLVLDEHENEVLAATYLDRSRTTRTVSVRYLRVLLLASTLPAAARAVAAIEALPDGRLLRLARPRRPASRGRSGRSTTWRARRASWWSDWNSSRRTSLMLDPWTFCWARSGYRTHW